MSTFVPAYLRLPPAELRARAEEALELLRPCRVCPRPCRGVDRIANRVGACRIGRLARVASAAPHHGEEDVLRGRRGSGTIFFSGCNLRCVFCQNFDISQAAVGAEVEAKELAEIMIDLQGAGCHNINLVTPEHVVPQILEALPFAVDRGLRLPVVYNTGAYDGEDTLRLLDGIVDIYMPDFKLWDPESAHRLLGVRDYPAVARCTIRHMHEQVGALAVDEQALAVRGVLLRHLMMPGHLDQTREILRFCASLSPDTYVNLMDQYRPAFHAATNPRYAEIGRPVTGSEIDLAYGFAHQAGLWRLDRRRR